MSHKINIFCLHCRFFLISMLIFPFLNAQTNFSKVDDWIDNNISNIGGRAVLLIWKDGKMIYENEKNELTKKQKFIGKWMERKTGKQIDQSDFNANTKQRIASCSKWLTAALAMTFIQENKLNIEDTIGKYLPVMTVNGKGGIRIWQCLSHTTGIKQIGVLATMTSDDDGEKVNKEEMRGKLKERLASGEKKERYTWSSMEAAIDSIAKTPMEGEPGKTFHYGNAGLQIIAAICEKIGNKDFETLFQERIAKPLKMKDTDFGFAKVPLAAGGAFSTPNNYMNFLQMILNDGNFNGKSIIQKALIIKMQTNYVDKDVKVVYTPAEAGNWGYGFGEWVMDNPVGNKRSNAVTSPGLFGTFPWVDNEKKYCAILFTLNMKSKGRGERYTTLKKLIDEAVTSKK